MADMKWTPVTERLPERSGKYIVTVEHDNHPFVSCSIFWFDGTHDVYDPSEIVPDKVFEEGYEYLFEKGFKGWCEYDENQDEGYGGIVSLYPRYHVTAWMPFPEPYKD